jgi:hypothetical protein
MQLAQERAQWGCSLNAAPARRVLNFDDVRCREGTPYSYAKPTGPCPLRDTCARFQAPIPRGNAKVADFRHYVVPTATGHACHRFLSLYAEPAAQARRVLPPLGSPS